MTVPFALKMRRKGCWRRISMTKWKLVDQDHLEDRFRRHIAAKRSSNKCKMAQWDALESYQWTRSHHLAWWRGQMDLNLYAQEVAPMTEVKSPLCLLPFAEKAVLKDIGEIMKIDKILIGVAMNDGEKAQKFSFTKIWSPTKTIPSLSVGPRALINVKFVVADAKFSCEGGPSLWLSSKNASWSGHCNAFRAA